MPLIPDPPPTLLGAVHQNQRHLADLTKTTGRGAPALRDASENVLSLNPESPVPLLSSDAHDVAVKFSEGALSVVDATGTVPQFLVTGSHDTHGDLWVERNVAASTMAANSVACGSTAINGGGIDGTTGSFGNMVCNYATVGGNVNTNALSCGTTTVNAGGFSGTSGSFSNVTCNYITVGGNVNTNALSCGTTTVNAGGFSGTSGSFSNMTCNYATVGGNIDIGALSCGGSTFVNSGGYTGTGASLGTITCNYITVGGTTSTANLAYGNIVAYSEQRLKRDIVDVDAADAASHLAGLRPREFEWRDRPERGRVRGFVVEEMPERFHREIDTGPDGDGPAWGYDLGDVVSTSVAVIKQLTGQVETLTARLDAALTRIDALEASA